ncbi:TetR family transcriptional regulator [Catenulispora yoronensis]|uniref:TetR family transcriptional regulator n=1 Tax=Catenulispora yoronensis TaxID=450799 RepID=A0ABN2UIE3_9ACTN
MTEAPGLRERKRQRTHEAIQDAATRLFLESGFRAVGVDQIAAAAEVSKRTLFKYFPSKEDLVVGSFADHADEPARMVLARTAGTSPLDALREYFLEGLAQRDPITGLDDRPESLAFIAMVLETPSLQAKVLLYQANAEEALADALRQVEGDVETDTARLAACQIYAMLRALAEDNRRHLTEGLSAEQRYPDAVRSAERAFELLNGGLGELYG